MKGRMRRSMLGVVIAAGYLAVAGAAFGTIGPGLAAPALSLKDTAGKSYDLSASNRRPMTILYFFDADSRPSLEGLLTLNQVAKGSKAGGLTVWAITTSAKEKASGFARKAGVTFPVLIDEGGKVSEAYRARQVLPSVCVVGPGGKVLDSFQGGGKATEAMLVRVAERSLQRKETALAKAIGEEVLKKNPGNAKARAVKGYAALRQKNLKEAESVFAGLAKQGGEAEVLGKEGLATVYAKGKQPEKALALAKEVEGKAPGRGYVNVVKGDILYAQNRKKEAEAEYVKASSRTEGEPYQQAARYNQLGRLYSSSDRYGKAREQFDKAVEIDPYYIEGTTNKGVVLEKEGKWDQALASYRSALAVNPGDAFAAALARRAEEMVALSKDAGRKERMDRLVKELADRFRAQKSEGGKKEDEWSSGPTVLTFVDFQEKGGLAERDGFSTVLLTRLSENLNASGRVKIVERALVERVLEELNLGSSKLADPDTALKLGKLFAARLIGTGSLLHLPEGSVLSLRVVDTETSGIVQTAIRTLDPAGSVDEELFRINREMLRMVMEKYPLRGFVAKVDGEEVLLNLGAKQGVVKGTRFDVLEEGAGIAYKGKKLAAAPKAVAQMEVLSVEPEFSRAKVTRKDRPLKQDDKVQERAN
ncbi:MAG: tetratricopeptide repeat protein [Deltaproteobacteria bacterium]|uniref:tetratricopeptide repeat protein n=1 Tax=Candidatus Deferrimicrobium sp. TaxID=3060586 RepID=UPI0027163D87|nr:redoxin domain-containing protein [Candidatus Deferrimicrobium sp.]MCR4308555.1 tetratricopeptide repeat protein [Deltaproteobacteria bacterium]MDO8739206.1 redoxin domain-containing protein [Candidatus Deferrimicrobium sp.]